MIVYCHLTVDTDVDNAIFLCAWNVHFYIAVPWFIKTLIRPISKSYSRFCRRGWITSRVMMKTSTNNTKTQSSVCVAQLSLW